MHRKKWAPALAGLIAATLVLGVVAAAVHQETGAKVAARPPATSNVQAGPSTTDTTATADPSGTTTTTTSLPATSGSTTPRTTVKPGAAPATRPPATATTAAPSTASTASGPAPTRPGTYTYTTGSLVISPPSGGTETWVRSGGSLTSTSVVLFNPSGVYTQSLTVFGATCTFASGPLALPPWPLTVGAAASATATCTGTISGLIVVMVRVGGVEAVSIAGTPISAFVVTTAITYSGTTLTQTDWYAPSLRLPVKTHLVVGTFVDETATLVSTTPA